MFGAALALASAATFALTNALFRRGVLVGSVLLGMIITVPMGALVFMLVALVSGVLPATGALSGESIALFATSGILHFVVGRYANFRAIKAAGTVISGPIVDSGILWTVLLALVLLGESITLLSGLGIALIIIGPTLIFGRMKLPKRTSGGFEPRYREGVVFALIASFCYGTSPILIGFAMPAEGGIVFGLIGGMISYCAAALVVLPALLFPRQRKSLGEADRTSVGWFSLSGVMISLSQMTRYMALAVAPVSIVTPILRTAILFRLYFAWLINRDVEVLSGGMLTATLLCALGVILVAAGA